MNPTIDEVESARKTMRDYYQRVEEGRRREKEERDRKWREANEGAWFEVEWEGWDGYDRDEHLSIKFIAQLKSATGQEGKMVWSNGLVTEGIWVNQRIPPERIPKNRKFLVVE